MAHSVPTAFITVMNAVVTEWVTPWLPRMEVGKTGSVLNDMDAIILGGGINPLLPYDFVASDMQLIYIICQCINIKHTFKGKYFERL